MSLHLHTRYLPCYFLIKKKCLCLKTVKTSKVDICTDITIQIARASVLFLILTLSNPSLDVLCIIDMKVCRYERHLLEFHA